MIPDLLNLTFYQIPFNQSPFYQIPDLLNLTFYQIPFFTRNDMFISRSHLPLSPHTTQYTIMRLLVPMVHFSLHDAN
jgi:hypothetical protein